MYVFFSTFFDVTRSNITITYYVRWSPGFLTFLWKNSHSSVRRQYAATDTDTDTSATDTTSASHHRRRAAAADTVRVLKEKEERQQQQKEEGEVSCHRAAATATVANTVRVEKWAKLHRHRRATAAGTCTGRTRRKRNKGNDNKIISTTTITTTMGIIEYDDELLLLLLLPPRGMAESNTNKESHWRGKSKGQNKTRMKSRTKKGKKWHFPTGNQLPYNMNTQRKRRGTFIDYCLLLCHTRLGTILIPYQWKDNTYRRSSSSQERRGQYSGIIIIRWFPLDNTLFIAPDIRYG